MKEMCKSIPYYVEWEKAVKTEYSIKIFKAAKRKIIKRFSKYNVAPDNAIYWVPDFQQDILKELQK